MELWFNHIPQAYAESHMVPAKSNKDVAGYTTEELLHAVPKIFKQFFRNLSTCVLDEPVRIAMMYAFYFPLPNIKLNLTLIKATVTAVVSPCHCK